PQPCNTRACCCSAGSSVKPWQAVANNTLRPTEASNKIPCNNGRWLSRYNPPNQSIKASNAITGINIRTPCVRLYHSSCTASRARSVTGNSAGKPNGLFMHTSLFGKYARQYAVTYSQKKRWPGHRFYTAFVQIQPAGGISP